MTCAFDFAYTGLSFDWVESFGKLKRFLSYIPLMHFIWVTPPISYYFYLCEECAQMFDKPYEY